MQHHCLQIYSEAQYSCPHRQLYPVAILTNSWRIDSTFLRWAACCACNLSISVSPDVCGSCFGVLSPEVLSEEAARFISGLGTFLANSRAFSRTDLVFGVSTFGLAAAIAIEACTTT